MNTDANSSKRRSRRAIALVALLASITAASARLQADTGTCGGQMITLPFTDVPASNIFFCSIAEAYFSALTSGTSPTTFNPSDPVPREQMAALITRTMDQSLKRGSRRAVLDQFWTTQGANNLGLTPIGKRPQLVKGDGHDLWVANGIGNTVSRVQASDGRVLETWTDANTATGVLCAVGKVFVTGGTTPGSLYLIDPTQTSGAVTTLSSGLGGTPSGIAYDGQKIWTANLDGSVSIITLNPVAVINVSAGFTALRGIIFDGMNIWVTDDIAGPVDKLRKLDSNGGILQSVDVGSVPFLPIFDGTNIWVPNSDSNTVSVVRAAGSIGGTVLATLSGNGLGSPRQASFDGQRILVTNFLSDCVSLWKASDFTPIGMFSTGATSGPHGVCSDGLNFWITLNNAASLARF